MKRISRRSFLEMAIALGATAAWGHPLGARSRMAWRERRELYPEGVASGDPDINSVLLWTRRPPADAARVETLMVEVAEDASFRRVVALRPTTIRVLSPLRSSAARTPTTARSMRIDG